MTDKKKTSAKKGTDPNPTTIEDLIPAPPIEDVEAEADVAFEDELCTLQTPDGLVRHAASDSGTLQVHAVGHLSSDHLDIVLRGDPDLMLDLLKHATAAVKAYIAHRAGN